MATEKLGLEEITATDADKFITFNRDMRQLEILIVGVKDRDLLTPPGSPATGDAYLLPATGTLTGAWASFANNTITHYVAGEWRNYIPFEGLSIWIADEDITLTYDSTAWVPSSFKSLGLSGTVGGEIPYASTSSSLSTDANFNYDEDTSTLNVPSIVVTSNATMQDIAIANLTASGNISASTLDVAGPVTASAASVTSITASASGSFGSIDVAGIITGSATTVNSISVATTSSLGTASADSIAVSGPISGSKTTVDGNLLVGGTTEPASADSSMSLFNGTVPTGSVTDGCVYYTADVSGSSEAFIRAEDGTVTQVTNRTGAFVPAISFGGGSVGVTYTTQDGNYTKIGNKTFFDLTLVLSSKGTSVGAILITLPIFTVADVLAATVVEANASVSYWDGLAVGFYNITASVQTGNVIALRGTKAAVTTLLGNEVTNTDVTNTFGIRITGSYTTT